MTARTRRRSSVAKSSAIRLLGSRRLSRRTPPNSKEFCTCGDPDIITPMVKCGHCSRWYHFHCVRLEEREAEDLATYFCPECSIATGKKAKELWELDENECASLHQEDEPPLPEPQLPHSSDEEEGSEDNFVAEADVVPSNQDDGDHFSDDDGIAVRIHRRGARKRKSISKLTSPAKRHKTAEAGPFDSSQDVLEDPIRQSCLKILVALLAPIFSERLPEEPDPPAEARTAEQFATSLEACIFEVYGDPNEIDGKSAGNKYRERIRMLNFNLGKKDRTELRQRIRVGRITPDMLSRMSSIDLANSQAQQEAHKIAEEAMNHSILQARTAPLRKTTHKGEEMIEQTVEAENWRVEEDESARERERDLQSVRSGTIASLAEASKTSAVPSTASTATPGLTQALLPIEPHSKETSKIIFDPASAVFNVDFDGEGSNMQDNRPPSPPELTGDSDHPSAVYGEDSLQISSPVSTSVSPMAQDFTLDRIFGTSGPLASMWNEPRESDGSTGALSPMGDDVAGIPDDTDFDEFITVEEDPPEPDSKSPQAENSGPIPEIVPSREDMPLANMPAIWQGHVGMPSIHDPTRMLRFRAEFKQVGGAGFVDVEANRRSLFPTPVFEIIGRVPTQQAIDYLVSMRLNPTKELFACVLIPTEEDRQVYLELHNILVGKDRYGLVFPWGHDPPLSAPGKELYIAPLLPEQPIPEYLQLLDNVVIPVQRDIPMFCGIFVLSKGRVTTLGPIDQVRPVIPVPNPAFPPTPTLPIAPVAPALVSSISHLSESSLATLSKDLATLSPAQLELVRSLLIPPPQPPTPLTPIHSHGNPLPHITQPITAPSQHPRAPGPSVPVNPPPGRSPAQNPTPASWDRPREVFPDRAWEPGPGAAAYYGRDEFRIDRPPYGRNDRPTRGRGPGPLRYRGRGGGSGSRW